MVWFWGLFVFLTTTHFRPLVRRKLFHLISKISLLLISKLWWYQYACFIKLLLRSALAVLPEACTMKKVQHTRVSLCYLFTFANAGIQQSREANYWLPEVNPGSPLDLQLKGVVLAVSDQLQTWTTAGSIAADFTKEDKIIQWGKHEKVKHIKETESNTPTADKGARWVSAKSSFIVRALGVWYAFTKMQKEEASPSYKGIIKIHRQEHERFFFLTTYNRILNSIFCIECTHFQQ